MSHSLVVDTKNVRSLVKIVERDLSKQPAQQGNRKMRLTRQGAEEFKRKFAELKPNVQEEISLMVKLADKLLWADLQQLTDGQSNFKPAPVRNVVLATFRAESGNSYMFCTRPDKKSGVLESAPFDPPEVSKEILKTMITRDMPHIKCDMRRVKTFSFTDNNITYHCYVITVDKRQQLTAKKLSSTPFTKCNWLTPEQLATTKLVLNSNAVKFVNNMPKKATTSSASKSTRARASATTRGSSRPRTSATRGRTGPKTSATRGRRSANAGAGEGRDFSGLKGGNPTGLPYSWYNASGGGTSGAPFHMSHFGGPLAKPYFPNC